MNVLESTGLSFIKIEPQEAFPDCVFVEDTAIAVNNRIFITNMAAPTRQGEITQIETVFKSIEEQLKLKIGLVKNKMEAFIDGGDCLYTGRELIVGLSTRTNLKGYFIIVYLYPPLEIHI